MTVNELCLKFASEVMPKYKTADGKPNAEQSVQCPAELFECLDDEAMPCSNWR